MGKQGVSDTRIDIKVSIWNKYFFLKEKKLSDIIVIYFDMILNLTRFGTRVYYFY